MGLNTVLLTLNDRRHEFEESASQVGYLLSNPEIYLDHVGLLWAKGHAVGEPPLSTAGFKIMESFHNSSTMVYAAGGNRIAPCRIVARKGRRLTIELPDEHWD